MYSPSLSQLLEVYCESVLTDIDPSLYVHLVDSYFAAVSVKSKGVSNLGPSIDINVFGSVCCPTSAF